MSSPAPRPLTDVTDTPDPQGVYRRLREEHGAVAPVELEPGVPAWLVMSWREVRSVVRSAGLYSRDPRNWRDWREGNVSPDSGLAPMMFPRRNAYFADGKEHERLRKPLDDGVQAALGRPGITSSVARTCESLMAGFARSGEADLLSEYAAVIPMIAVASLFGLDAGRGRELQRALVALFGSGGDAQAGNREFEEIIAGAIRSHRQAPADDLTSLFLGHPSLRDEDEVAQAMALMISAGYETTTTWIAQAIRLILTDGRFSLQVRGGSRTVGDALDEVLWREPPMACMPARYALRDTELAGRRIAEGDALIMGLMAAAYDPQVRAAGEGDLMDEFNGVARAGGEDPWQEFGNVAHLAWSAGPHACPARDIARVIARTAVQAVLDGLPGLRLAVPAEEITILRSPWTRCPASIPVTFTPRR